MAKRKVTDEQIATALIKAMGIVAQAARSLEIDRKTLQERIARSAYLQDVREEAEEVLLDAAEGVLYAMALKDRDGLSLRYLLDAKGARRGYGKRRMELSGAEGAPLVFEVSIPVARDAERPDDD